MRICDEKTQSVWGIGMEDFIHLVCM